MKSGKFQNLNKVDIVHSRVYSVGWRHYIFLDRFYQSLIPEIRDFNLTLPRALYCHIGRSAEICLSLFIALSHALFDLLETEKSGEMFGSGEN